MKINFFARCKRAAALVALFLVCLSCTLFGGGRYALNTISSSAESGDFIAVHKYELEMTVRADRKVEVEEHIQVEFLREYNNNGDRITMFYRSLPIDGARYSDIRATCEENDAFYFYVEDNPDDGDFVDVCCVGNANKGSVWIYDISYVMEQNVDNKKNGMIIDVIGFGWTVALHNVSARVNLPSSIQPADYTVHTDIFGSATTNQVTHAISADGRSIFMEADVLGQGWSSLYEEYVTGGITLEFDVGEGVLADYLSTRVFTFEFWMILLAALGGAALAFGLRMLTKEQREMVTVVNIKAPDEMDPLKMGKWLDGNADNEDLTSMIYYFANKGYLRIDLSDEDDPEMIKLVSALPDSAPVYEKTLFTGLFANGSSVRVSAAAGSFYDHMEKAKLQLPKHPTMYEKKSVFGYVGGCLIGLLLGFFACFFMGRRLGGDYGYFLGVLFGIPLAVIGFMGSTSENYRYKWRPKQRAAMLAGQIAVAVVSGVIFSVFFANFIMTPSERVVLCIGVFGACFMTQGTLSRTEKYCNALSDILGFKDFIVVTEEDRIQFMLEEDPQLYYKILPYAQVLGVTDEWENKFAKLTIPPPTWCAGAAVSYNHYYIHHSVNGAMRREIAAELARRGNSGGGGHVGSSGGGRSFGGFGGGGFGGGGGGAR